MNLERFCRPTEMLLVARRRTACKDFFVRVKVLALKLKPKEDRARLFYERRVKSQLFRFLRWLTANKRRQVVDELQQFVREREALSLEMREFNLKRKALDGWGQVARLAAEVKSRDRGRIAKGDVVGVKVDQFKKAIQEAKEAALIKQLEEERDLRRKQLEAYQREQQMKVLADRRKLLEQELGLYQPLAEDKRIDETGTHELKDQETEPPESNEDLLASNEEIRPSHSLRNRNVTNSNACNVW